MSLRNGSDHRPLGCALGSPFDRWWLHLLLIAAIGLIAYYGSFSGPFYFDDHPCIVENPLVHDLGNLKHLGEYWKLGITEDIRNNVVTRFVTYLTFAANYRLHGLAVAGYHLVNLAIHLLNALLVYQLVRLLMPRNAPAGRRQADGDRTALLAALLFVAHPVQTTAVTYIVQRFAVLATFFCLVALVGYLHAFRAPSPRRQKVFYGGALLATVAAMFTKEIAFTLPLLIAICDGVFLPGTARQRLRRIAPFAATLTLLPLTVMTLSAVSEVTGQSAANALDLANIGHVSRWQYFFTQWRVLITYLQLLIFPSGLRLEYDYPLATSPWEPATLASGLLLAALFGLGIWLLRRNCTWAGGGSGRLAGFGIVWFFVALSMESSVIPLDDLIFEYRLYLPSVGVFITVVACINWGWRRLAVSSASASRGAAIAAAVLVALLAGATVQRNRIWQDDLAFWQDNVAKSPRRARPRCSLAIAYKERGDFAKAIVELETARRLNPSYWPAFESLGDLRWNLGLYPLAATDYAEALHAGNHSRALRLKLGRAQRRSGDLAAARATFSELLAVDPDDREGLAELQSLPR